jgi:predicted RNA-binding Zn ribbon-like protein
VDYGALVDWARRTGVVDAAESDALLSLAGAHPAEAERVVERARALRRVLYGIFSRVGSTRMPLPADLAALNRSLPEALAHLQVRRAGEGGYVWAWDEPSGVEALARVLWPVARSAAELLTAPELERVRLCDADDCGYLFVDASRNRSRRWCDMADCGNLAKVRRFRARQRERTVGG